MNTFKARVVHLSICEDNDCCIVDMPHLVVYEECLDLEHGNATAISYTWGQFSREIEHIGHTLDGSLVRMELGKEWDIQELVKTLSDLCSGNEFCWIDQLCVKQDDSEEVRKTLARIPDIYRTFDVIVLLPGSPCSCIEYSVTGNFPETSPCPNNHAWANWFSRLWTRQELFYASKITTRWTNPAEITCIRDYAWRFTMELHFPVNYHTNQRLVAGLSRYARLEWRERLGNVTQRPGEEQPVLTATVRNVWRWIITDAITGYNAAVTSLITWKKLQRHVIQTPGPSTATAVVYNHQLLREFLKGPGFAVARPEAIEDDDSRLDKSMSQFRAIHSNPRSATQLRDYVVAVWIDCPGYKLPISYKEMSLGNLLGDAIQQLETNHGLGFTTVLPAGLLSLRLDLKRTAIWRPSVYLDALCVKSTFDVYGVVRPDTANIGLEVSGLPIRHFYPPAPVRTLYDYETLFDDTPPKEAMEFIVTIAKHWGNQTMRDFCTGFAMFNRDVWDDDLMGFILYLSSSNSIGSEVLAGLGADGPDFMTRIMRRPGGGMVTPFSLDEQGNFSWNSTMYINHLKLTYEIVACCFRIDPKNAKALGLRVMVDIGGEGTPPRIGFSKANYGLGDSGPTYTIQNGWQCVGVEDSDDPMLWEVCCRPDLTLRVIGVWLPCGKFPQSALMGEVCIDTDLIDAWIDPPKREAEEQERIVLNSARPTGSS